MCTYLDCNIITNRYVKGNLNVTFFGNRKQSGKNQNPLVVDWLNK